MVDGVGFGYSDGFLDMRRLLRAACYSRSLHRPTGESGPAWAWGDSYPGMVKQYSIPTIVSIGKLIYLSLDSLYCYRIVLFSNFSK